MAEKFDQRVLVVDDMALTREMVRHIVLDLGFVHIVTATNGATALKIIKEQEIGLVICDWMMPEMNGLELLQAVRSEARFKKLPFLMLTAEAYRENIAEAAYAGVTEFVSKPFTADMLGQKVYSALGIAIKKKG